MSRSASGYSLGSGRGHAPRARPALGSAIVLITFSAAVWIGLAAAPGGDDPLEVIPGTDRGRPPDPLMASIMARADTAADAQWETEILNDAIQTRLDEIGRLISSGKPVPVAATRGLAAPGFSGGPLRPGSLEEIFSDGATKVRRAREGIPGGDAGAPHRGAEGLARALSDLAAPLAGLGGITVEFLPVRLERRAGGIEVSARYHAAGIGPAGSVEQTAIWHGTWTPSATGGAGAWLLQSIRAEEFDEVTGPPRGASLFSDTTEAVLGANRSFRGMILYGVDHWLERMESWIESDSFGHNGMALGDVNGDGLDDLYLCQMAGLPNLLFVQNPDGTATDVSAEAGVDWLERTRSALFVDLDNDGDQDLVVATSVALLFMANDGKAHFKVNATLSVPEGLVSVSGPAAPTTSVGTSPEDSAAGHYSRAGDISGTRTSDIVMMAAADYDQDGFVDIYACAYHAASQDADRFPIPVPYHDANNGGENLLLKNDGQWRFTNVTRETGLDQNNHRFSFAAAWEDYDNDGDQDLYVANDFGRKNLYRNDGGRFTDVAAAAGVEDVAAGMSASWGDYDNDGWMDLYTGNMFSAAGSRLAHQAPFMQGASPEVRSHYQRHARGNSLFHNGGDGTFRDVSLESGTTLGRWAWGSIFADINNDGWEDLLVTNGYFTRDDPADLCSFFWRQVVASSPDRAVDPATIPYYAAAWKALGRLIREGRSFNGRERKCAFLNTRGPRFATVSATAGFDFIDDGRSVAVTDWDSDGDLDVWLQNRTGPRLRLARNDLAEPGRRFVSFALEGRRCNRDAIGARVELYSAGKTRPAIRSLRAGDGYLAQSSKWVHFGLGETAKLDRVVVRWPGGAAETFKGIEPGRRYRLVQTTGRAEPAPPRPAKPALAAAREPLAGPPPMTEARIFLSAPVPAPSLSHKGLDGRDVAVEAGTSPAVLLNLWGSWCAPCVKELGDLSARHGELKARGVRVIALSLDGLMEEEGRQGDGLDAARKLAADLKLPFDVGAAPGELIDKLRLMQSRIIWAPRPYAIPSSFLIDADGLVSVIYKGPVAVDQILKDLPALRFTGERRLAMALPFPGIRQTRSMPDRFDHMGAIAQAYADGGYPDEAIGYFRRVLRIKPNDAGIRFNLATALAGEGQIDEAIEQYQAALAIRPDDVAVLSNLGFALAGKGRTDEAIGLYRRALDLEPNNVSTLTNFGAALAAQGKLDEAVAQYRLAVKADSTYGPAINNLAVALARQGNLDEADDLYRKLIELDPGNAAVRLNLAMTLARRGKPEESARQLAEAVRLRPDLGQARYFLALIQARQGKTEEAARQISDLMRVPAGSPEADVKLAWALATHGDGAWRDGAAAIKVARKVCGDPDAADPACLDALAAGYAESGQYPEAVRTARRAVEAASARGQTDLASQIRGRLQLYEGGRPYHDGASSN